MNTAGRTFAVYVKAVSPKYTYQLMFSENPDREQAVAECLAEFDGYWPEAKDRTVDRVLEYGDYLAEIEQADRLNYWMST